MSEGGTRALEFKRFLVLNMHFPLRPIRTDKELATANEIISKLLAREELDSVEDDYLDVLGDLVLKYEEENHPLPNVAGEDVLRHIIEARGLTQAQIARGAEIAEPTISAILAGRRMLNRSHIEALSRFLGVSPSVFVPS
jgi:HTH-type transcriptional regulator/antitoxin HigA